MTVDYHLNCIRMWPYINFEWSSTIANISLQKKKIVSQNSFIRHHQQNCIWNRFPFLKSEIFPVDWLANSPPYFRMGEIRLGHCLFSVYKANTLISSIYIKANTLLFSLSFTMPWWCVPPSNNILYASILFNFEPSNGTARSVGPSLSSFVVHTIFESCARGKHELRAAWCGKTSFLFSTALFACIAFIFYIQKSNYT